MTTVMSKNVMYLLVAILLVALVVGIFSYQVKPASTGDKIGKSISDIINSTEDGLDEFVEEVKDEIDDNTTTK